MSIPENDEKDLFPALNGRNMYTIPPNIQKHFAVSRKLFKKDDFMVIFTHLHISENFSLRVIKNEKSPTLNKIMLLAKF